MLKKSFLRPWFFIVLLVLLGILAALVPGYRFTGFILWGIAFVIFCYWFLGQMEAGQPNVVCWLRRIFTVFLCVLLLAAAVTGVTIIGSGAGNPEESCDYLIVLGAGVNGTTPSLSLRERLDAAATYLQQHPETQCILSGGQGNGEDITEAECMFRYLTAAGIPKDRLIKEDKATSTQENLAFSLALMERTPQTRIGILSSEYHLHRAKLMALDQGFIPVLIPAKTTWVTLRMNYYMREVAAVWYYMIFGGQQHDFSFLCGPVMGLRP